jgi:hypothetical protein
VPCGAGELPRQQALVLQLARGGLAALAVLLATLAFAAPASAANPRLSRAQAITIAQHSDRIQDWIASYHSVATTADFDSDRTWTVHFNADGQEVAQGGVDDATGRLTHTYIGPQVAWQMARGDKGAFGRKINDPAVWLALCAVFLVGLVDLRRPFSLRTLDLLVLLSFSLSLWAFNAGTIFWSVPLSYPPMIYLLGRMAWIGFRGARQPLSAGSLPIWVLAGAAVFLIGFRGGLNRYDSNVIDVGYSGVVGADILLRGGVPYGHMPVTTAEPCGIRYANGTSSAYRQADGRCESPDERGDTYGPVAYAAYVPAVAALGWSGRWADDIDGLAAAHVTSVVFDALCALGLFVAGRMLGGVRLGTALAFAWVAYPFTAWALESNTNDMIVAAGLIWAFVALTLPLTRGFLLALATWTKFAPLLLAPLWARYPRVVVAEERPPGRGRTFAAALVPDRRELRYLAGFGLGTLCAGLLIVSAGSGALDAFWDRTFGWQVGRSSPFSLWDWGIYPGYPDLGWLHTILQVALAAFALALLAVPRRLNAVRLAALSTAVLVGTEIVLTHWYYAYIPWFFPFAMLALCAPVAET